ncbi:hypothetical protein FKP32DRAFT_1692306 [Trametes sanguinea]|nr:hypothetical protein FKP32DRAFT_1692306 [Trametes sanguinea]
MLLATPELLNVLAFSNVPLSVSQQLWACSSEGAVWTRKLEREKYSLPSQRGGSRTPSTREWDARYLHNWTFDAYRIMVDMVLLPGKGVGGQYIVASVPDQFWWRFLIRVFISDFEYSMASHIAQMGLPTKALEQRAKYMTFRGKAGDRPRLHPPGLQTLGLQKTRGESLAPSGVPDPRKAGGPYLPDFYGDHVSFALEQPWTGHSSSRSSSIWTAWRTVSGT